MTAQMKAYSQEIFTETQIRYFRLCAHHLDRWHTEATPQALVGACGMVNTPPGVWETALFNRWHGCALQDCRHLLYDEKRLLQAWSLRGAPTIFPTDESATFLNGLLPSDGQALPKDVPASKSAASDANAWIYTRGITLALDYLGMSFDEVFSLLQQVLPRLDDTKIVSKSALDQTLAAWITPLLPEVKRVLWEAPSMYGNDKRQTVGGAAVSFLLRPAAFLGLVVFGEREGINPTFTSFKRWVGHPLLPTAQSGSRPMTASAAPQLTSGLPAPSPLASAQSLTRKFLHCYGPANGTMLSDWLGCSGPQARQMLSSIEDELLCVNAAGKKGFILASDLKHLQAPPEPSRRLVLLGGHDPYLDQRDRQLLLADRSRHKQVWRTVSNPGVILEYGKIAGLWTEKKRGQSLEIHMTLWADQLPRPALEDLAEQYAHFRQLRLTRLSF